MHFVLWKISTDCNVYALRFCQFCFYRYSSWRNRTFSSKSAKTSFWVWHCFNRWNIGIITFCQFRRNVSRIIYQLICNVGKSKPISLMLVFMFLKVITSITETILPAMEENINAVYGFTRFLTDFIHKTKAQHIAACAFDETLNPLTATKFILRIKPIVIRLLKI